MKTGENCPGSRPGLHWHHRQGAATTTTTWTGQQHTVIMSLNTSHPPDTLHILLLPGLRSHCNQATGSPYNSTLRLLSVGFNL